MIQGHNSAYSSPLSHEMIQDYRRLIMTRIEATASLARSNEDKMQRTLKPEIKEIFQAGRATTLVDLFA